MVNKISENSYYNYTKTKTLDIPDTDEKFSLGYKQNELSSELQDKKDISKKEKQQAAERIGVRLDISINGRTAGADGKKAEEPAKRNTFEQMPLLETIRAFGTKIVSAVRDFFDEIWNNPQDENAQNFPEPEEIKEFLKITEISETAEAFGGTDDSVNVEPDNHTDEESRSREIQRYLQNGEREQAINLLTDNGNRTAARNSSIMTCYNKDGKVVEMNVHDRKRIFDRNIDIST